MNNNTVQIVKVHESQFKRFIVNPFKYYARAGKTTFCIVLFTNTLTTLFYTDRLNFLINYPQLYFTGLTFKSIYFGMLWPSYYLTLIKDPKDACVLGAGIERNLCKEGITVEKIMVETKESINHDIKEINTTKDDLKKVVNQLFK